MEIKKVAMIGAGSMVNIGADICQQRDKESHHVLDDVQDKVVQDIDGSEGAGIWSNTQATSLHVPASTISTAHYLRIASAYRGDRIHVKETFYGSSLPSKFSFKYSKGQEAFIEDLRQAVYTTCLASYVQGINVIDVADKQNKWAIDYGNIVKIWRAGCIIQSDHISSLLAAIFQPQSDTRHQYHNLLYEPSIVGELEIGFELLKRIVVKGVEGNVVVPSMSATLDYLKYMGNLELRRQSYEAELDYFGKHMYDSKSNDQGPGPPETGRHYFVWKPA